MSSPTEPQRGIGQVAAEWVDSRLALRTMTAPTAGHYRRHLASFADHVGPRRAVADIDAADVRSWIAALRKPNGDRPKASTLNTIAASVRSFFGDQHRLGYIDRDPTIGVPRAKVGQRKPKSVDDEVIDRMLEVADLRARTLILLLVHTGLRRAEAAGLHIEQWDRRASLITAIGKGDKEETVAVSPELAEALDEWLAALPGRRTTGPLFESPVNRGEPLHPRTLNRILDRVVAAAELEGHVTPHQMRHTLATRMFAEGAPANVVRRQLRHASLNTTSLYSQAEIGQVLDHVANASSGRFPRAGRSSGASPNSRRRRRPRRRR